MLTGPAPARLYQPLGGSVRPNDESSIMNRTVTKAYPEFAAMETAVPGSRRGLLFRVGDNGPSDGAETMRSAVLELLNRRPRAVDDVAASLQLPRMDAVRHLDWLHRLGLVKRRRAGNRIFYYPSGEQPGPGL